MQLSSHLISGFRFSSLCPAAFFPVELFILERDQSSTRYSGSSRKAAVAGPKDEWQIVPVCTEGRDERVDSAVEGFRIRTESTLSTSREWASGRNIDEHWNEMCAGLSNIYFHSHCHLGVLPFWAVTIPILMSAVGCNARVVTGMFPKDKRRNFLRKES
ncbi:hypothetical protein R1flu_019887 [Riccia fluitans]|uniref:Uncharacterized protein n=1 Tax=Riccia fluitans TaxID=41844 RepID=A0ABD1ZNF4_9MARC